MRNPLILRKSARWVALAVAFAFVAGGVLATSAPRAGAVASLRKVQSDITTSTPGTFKIAFARCDGGERVVGGGGLVNDFGAGRVRLTVLQPIHSATGGSFEAAAEAPTGFSGSWWVQAYAICAPISTVPVYQIVDTDNPGRSSATVQATTAQCPGSMRVLGTGARVEFTGRHVGLQLTRSSGPLDISRAQARADAGYQTPWRLTSYAVCVNQLPGQQAQTRLWDGASSGSVGCPTIDGQHTYVHGAGGGASGLSWLQEVFPLSGLQQVRVSTTLPADTAGDLLAHAVCAY